MLHDLHRCSIFEKNKNNRPNSGRRKKLLCMLVVYNIYALTRIIHSLVLFLARFSASSHEMFISFRSFIECSCFFWIFNRRLISWGIRRDETILRLLYSCCVYAYSLWYRLRWLLLIRENLYLRMWLFGDQSCTGRDQCCWMM